MLIFVSASAMSVREFEAKSPQEQATFIANYAREVIEKEQAHDPVRAQKINDYFFVKKGGKSVSDGWTDFFSELDGVEDLGAHGQANLDKVQVEWVFKDVIDQKFPPSPKPSSSSAH